MWTNQKLILLGIKSKKSNLCHRLGVNQKGESASAQKQFVCLLSHDDKHTELFSYIVDLKRKHLYYL